MSSRPAAVLFDMDGLLIDTEHMWFDVETQVLAGYGAHWAPEDQERLVGSSLPYATAIMAERAGAGADPAEIGRRLMDAMEERFRSVTALMPGAAELIAEIDAVGIPRALVSSTYRRLVDAALGALAPLRFDVTVAGDEVENGKPQPDPYLKAAGLLGVEARDCVALEDSPRGAASAAAAGCVVVAVPSLVALEPGPRQHVVATLYDVSLAWLRTLFA